jgi:hypothetical protein
MPLPAGDLLAGAMKGIAQGLSVLAGRKPIEESKGVEIQADALTDDEFEQAKSIRDAQARKAKK